MKRCWSNKNKTRKGPQQVFWLMFLFLVISINSLEAITNEKEDEKKKPVKAPDVTVVVTAAKQEQDIGSVTQKIDVITQEEVKTIVTGNRNISETIMYKPGASVSALSRNDANWGTYGGIGPKYCIYMLQGLPIDAFMDPMSLDIAAVAQIEILRGPASVLYPTYLSQDFAGSQSPLAGTVNLILKDWVEKRSTQLSMGYGSYNTLNAQFYHQDNARYIHYFAGGSYEMSDYADYGTANSWLNMKDKPEYRKTKLYSGITFALDKEKNHKFGLFVNKTFHKGDAGRTYRGFNHQYLTLNGSYFIQLAGNISLQAGIGLRKYNRQWQESVFDVEDHLLSNNGAYQNIAPANITLSIGQGVNHLLTLGMDYQVADYHTWSDPLLGYKLYGNKSIAQQMGLYAQEELRFENLIIRGGLRFGHIINRIDFINAGAPGLKNSKWNKLLWSAGLRYTITPSFAFYANAGSSFIPPD
jgi:outer membrane receptor protein involved in Fe transport